MFFGEKLQSLRLLKSNNAFEESSYLDRQSLQTIRKIVKSIDYFCIHNENTYLFGQNKIVQHNKSFTTYFTTEYNLLD